MKGVLLKQRSSRRTTLTQATATTQLLNGGVVVGGGDYDGWFGDPESDIPLSLLPKHVTGLHAADDMAMLTVSQSVPCSLSAPRSFAAASTFLKDFEAIHTLRLQQNGGGGGAELRLNGCSTSNGAASASVFPDILSGGRGE